MDGCLSGDNSFGTESVYIRKEGSREVNTAIKLAVKRASILLNTAFLKPLQHGNANLSGYYLSGCGKRDSASVLSHGLAVRARHQTECGTSAEAAVCCLSSFAFLVAAFRFFVFVDRLRVAFSFRL
jgi:hypothetical protein